MQFTCRGVGDYLFFSLFAKNNLLMLLLLILIGIIAVFASMHSKNMKKMKEETPNLYLLTNAISYGVMFLIIAFATSQLWLIVISWIVITGCFITAIVAIVALFKKSNAK